MTSNDVSFEFERFPNPKIYHFYYKPIHNDSYDISSPIARKTLKRKVVLRKEATISSAGKKKIMKALKAYQKGEVKEFQNLNDLMEELNS